MLAPNLHFDFDSLRVGTLSSSSLDSTHLASAKHGRLAEFLEAGAEEKAGSLGQPHLASQGGEHGIIHRQVPAVSTCLVSLIPSPKPVDDGLSRAWPPLTPLSRFG